MRVVVVHNYYDSRVPSGENSAVDDDLALLPTAGVDVVPFVTTSDRLLASRSARLQAASAPIYSRGSRRAMAALVRRVDPDLVHVHNIYPRPGPSIVLAAEELGVPVVQTVHNRRLSCISGTHFRDGHRCTDCVGRRVQWPGVAHACYRGSAAQSLLMAGGAAVHHTRLRNLDHYFAVSEEIAQVLRASGVPAERITTKPNPVVDWGIAPLPDQRRVLYAGRLDTSKGARVLLDAWLSLAADSRPVLRVCGSGPLESLFADVAREEPMLEFLGQRTAVEVRRHMAESTVVVIPSIAGEGLPRVLAEAFAAGRGVVATQSEPLASAVGLDRGWLFLPSVESVAAALSALSASSAQHLEHVGAAARAYYDQHFQPARVLALQLAVYERVARLGRKA